MSFLAPLFLLGLAAIAIPVIVHLIQRERKRVIAFPSLMFVQKIPYQSVRRRRIRHWPLLLMRALAIALIVAAFARPFLQQGAAALAAAGGSREVVILLDRSASMGYGDYFQRAKDAARNVIGSLTTGDKATLVLFGRNAEESMRATSDQARLSAVLDTAKVSAGATRFGPALKLAESILTQSTAPRREAVLISDFQKSGWTGAEDVHFDEQLRLTPMSIAQGAVANVAVPSVTFARGAFSGEERVTVTAGIANKGGQPVADVPVSTGNRRTRNRDGTRERGGRCVDLRVVRALHARRAGHARLRQGGHGPLPRRQHVPLRHHARQAALRASRRFRRTERRELLPREGAEHRQAPAFQVEQVPAGRANPSMLAGRSVVILNDTVLPPGPGGRRAEAVRRSGRRPARRGGRKDELAPVGGRPILPAKIGAPVDRLNGRGGAIGYRRLQPSRLRSLQGAAQRRLLGRPRPALPHARTGDADRPDPRALRRWGDGGGGATDRDRTGHRVRHLAGRLVERPGPQAGVPAAGAPIGEVPRPLRAVRLLADGRSGRRPLGAAEGPGRRGSSSRRPVSVSPFRKASPACWSSPSRGSTRFASRATPAIGPTGLRSTSTRPSRT